MKAEFRSAVLYFAVGMAVAPSILACGEKLTGLGGGVPFARIHPEHYVGQIVVFARRDSELQAFNEQGRFSHHLERSGFTVRLIDNERDLDGALHDKPTDLILAAPADAQALRARLTGHSSAPLVLGLAAVPAANAGAGPVVSNCLLQASFNQSMSVMRTVEDFMNRRQSGTKIDCAGAAERS